MAESIFSDQWYKLSGLHPFLRPTVVVERQWVRGELWYLLTPTTGSATYRLNKSAYSFIGRCNGKKNIQAIWDDLLAAEPEATLTQHEVIELLITVQAKGFVEFEKTADARQLLDDIATERNRETRQKLNPLAFKVKLGNPQRFLSKIEWLAPIVFLILSKSTKR
jgi:putative peptide zinc metalloprotease protein